MTSLLSSDGHNIDIDRVKARFAVGLWTDGGGVVHTIQHMNTPYLYNVLKHLQTGKYLEAAKVKGDPPPARLVEAKVKEVLAELVLRRKTDGMASMFARDDEDGPTSWKDVSLNMYRSHR